MQAVAAYQLKVLDQLRGVAGSFQGSREREREEGKPYLDSCPVDLMSVWKERSYGPGPVCIIMLVQEGVKKSVAICVRMGFLCWE